MFVYDTPRTQAMLVLLSVLLLACWGLAAQVNPAGQHGVDLSWAASASANVSGYSVYRSTASGGCATRTAATCAKVTASLVTGTAFTDGCPANPPASCASALVEGQTYVYVVTATGPGGESANSTEFAVKIPANPPAAPTALTGQAH